MPLDEASVKIRTGGPIDDQADMGDDIWAGVAPFGLNLETLEPDEATNLAERHMPTIASRLFTGPR